MEKKCSYTEQICGFCDKAEYTTMDIDEAIYHCSENDTNVAFTCPSCDKFIKARRKTWGNHVNAICHKEEK